MLSGLLKFVTALNAGASTGGKEQSSGVNTALLRSNVNLDLLIVKGECDFVRQMA